MQFTPQQAAGGIKFKPHTLIGNWREDLALQDMRLADYMDKKVPHSNAFELPNAGALSGPGGRLDLPSPNPTCSSSGRRTRAALKLQTRGWPRRRCR